MGLLIFKGLLPQHRVLQTDKQVQSLQKAPDSYLLLLLFLSKPITSFMAQKTYSKAQSPEPKAQNPSKKKPTKTAPPAPPRLLHGRQHRLQLHVQHPQLLERGSGSFRSGASWGRERSRGVSSSPFFGVGGPLFFFCWEWGTLLGVCVCASFTSLSSLLALLLGAGEGVGGGGRGETL